MREVPGAGLLRDGQKWAAWWALPLALGAGLGARRLAARARRACGAALGAVAAGAALLPVAALPDLVWVRAAACSRWPTRPTGSGVPERAVPGRLPRATCWCCRSARYRRVRAGTRSRLAAGPGSRWLTRPTVTDDTLVVERPRRGGRGPAGPASRSAVGDPARLAAWGRLDPRRAADAGGPGAADVQSCRSPSPSRAHAVPDPGAVAGPSPTPERVTAVRARSRCALGVVVGAALWISLAGLYGDAPSSPPRKRSANEVAHAACSSPGRRCRSRRRRPRRRLGRGHDEHQTATAAPPPTAQTAAAPPLTTPAQRPRVRHRRLTPRGGGQHAGERRTLAGQLRPPRAGPRPRPSAPGSRVREQPSTASVISSRSSTRTPGPAVQDRLAQAAGRAVATVGTPWRRPR